MRWVSCPMIKMIWTPHTTENSTFTLTTYADGKIKVHWMGSVKALGFAQWYCFTHFCASPWSGLVWIVDLQIGAQFWWYAEMGTGIRPPIRSHFHRQLTPLSSISFARRSDFLKHFVQRKTEYKYAKTSLPKTSTVEYVYYLVKETEAFSCKQTFSFLIFWKINTRYCFKEK